MSDEKLLEKMRRDGSLLGEAIGVAYKNIKGTWKALTGVDDGPFVVPVEDVLVDATLDGDGESFRILKGEHYFTQAAFYNNNADTTFYIMVFDQEELPANGAIPRWTCVPAAPGVTTALDIPGAIHFEYGIVVAISTTPMSFTAAGADVGSISIFYLRSRS
jgi:hypothetical protein